MFVYCGDMTLVEATDTSMGDHRCLEDRVAETVGLLNVVTAGWWP